MLVGADAGAGAGAGDARAAVGVAALVASPSPAMVPPETKREDADMVSGTTGSSLKSCP